MPKLITHKMRVRIAEARLLFQQGMGRTEVIAAIRDKYEVSYSQANRTFRYVEEQMVKDINRERGALVARQSAKLNHAQKVAMSLQKPFVHWIEAGGEDGSEAIPEVHKEDAPDLTSFLTAVRDQNKLLGLNAPEQRQILIANVADMVTDLADLVRDFIPNLDRRREFLRALKNRVQERLREKPELLPDIVDPSVVVGSSSGEEPNLLEEGANGTPERNGHE